MSPAPDSPAPGAVRLTSLDAMRGFVMLLMGLELLHLDEVATSFPQSKIWQCIGFHSWHVPWVGCSLHDLIHPAFAFMVGVSLAYSLRSRKAVGQGVVKLWRHALQRSLVLVLLGVFIRSLGRGTTFWTFEDTLTQIGLGFPFLFALGFASQRTRWLSIIGILLGYWLFFALHPLPTAEMDAIDANIPDYWEHHATGFYAHWNLNRNAAWDFDRWFLNVFPRTKPWLGYSGGYNTLNFIPSLANMILGLIAGTWLRQPGAPPGSVRVVHRLLITGLAGILLGLSLHGLGICPLIKKLWTPAWMLFSGGWSCLMMAAFYHIMDVRYYQKWAFPLVVIGLNSLAMYLLFHTMDVFLEQMLERHFGPGLFLLLGPDLRPVLLGAPVLLILWLILFWMHRRKLYLRI